MSQFGKISKKDLLSSFFFSSILCVRVLLCF